MTALYTASYHYVAEIDGMPADTPCVCGACDWHGPLAELDQIGDCSLTPGDPSPAGRCPREDCGSIAYLDTPEDHVRDAAPALLAAARAALAWWHDNPRNFERREPAWLKEARAAIAQAEGKEPQS